MVLSQHALSVVVGIKPAEVAVLRQLLESIGNDIGGNPHIQFESLETTHFARWVVVDQDKNLPPCLAFESNYDGPFDAHLKDWIAHGAAGLDEIYGHCEGYPAAGTRNFDAFRKFIQDHSIRYQAFYIAYRGQTIGSIRNDAKVRIEIEDFLDAQQKAGTLPASPAAVHQLIQKHLQSISGLSLDTADHRPFGVSLNAFLAALGAIALLYVGFAVWELFVKHEPVAFAILLLFVVLVSLFFGVLRLKEKTDPEGPFRDIPVASLAQKEDIQVQNQLTHIVNIKPGWFRGFTLRFVLRSINLLAILSFNQGSLGNIPTIHFARWFILKGNRLLFFSNFDGSWENYLGDFIDKASAGLTGVWSNTVQFPQTRFLVSRGATDEEHFKQWTREHQIPTQVWYSAHPDDTVRNILNNVQIRAGVNRKLNNEQAKKWLSLL